MIVKFSVTNFRSIREKVELRMEETSLKGLPLNTFQGQKNINLLKSAILYGSNASGKSSLLRAFKALEYLVLRSSGFKPDEKIVPYEPHKLEQSFAKAPVFFCIDFISNGVRFEFNLSFTEKQIEKEELFYYPHAVRTLLYARTVGKDIKFGESYRGGKKTIEKLLLDNQLFISKAAENNVESVQEPYRFFAEGLMVFPLLEEYRKTSLSRLYAKRLAEDRHSKFSKRFNSLICALDTGITSVSAEEVDWESYKFPSNMPDDVRIKFQEDYKYNIKTQHPVFAGEKFIGNELFEVEEESTGTQSLFVIGGIIVDALETGRVLIVDEFEKNLHPSITQYLIQLFHNPLTNPLNAQLIFATHDITQLAHDGFRRDQVWFVEKSEYGATSLYQCSDIKGIRLGTPLDKWYSSGRFGATPIINDVDFLIEMQENEAQ